MWTGHLWIGARAAIQPSAPPQTPDLRGRDHVDPDVGLYGNLLVLMNPTD
jgi:hypothetical protein